VKNSALSFRLFIALLCEDLRTYHKVLLFHTKVRWLSKGNMFGRVYELKKAVALFFEFQGKDQFVQVLKKLWLSAELGISGRCI
jgi:hypothetical protein